MNDTGDVYSPEYRVKRFLDSIAYFLLLGYTQGIETDYKRVMHAKREIPASSCPANIQNMLYAGGGLPESADREESARFRVMCEILDDRAAPYEAQKTRKVNIESGQHKRARLGIHGGEWLNVDTDGKFWYGKDRYQISDQAAQYAPIPTDYGDYYAMDRILASGGKFYDMNYDPVVVYHIGGRF